MNTSLKKLGIGLFFGGCLLLTLNGCGGGGGGDDGGNNQNDPDNSLDVNGVWKGSTSQNKPISFVITGNGVSSMTIGYAIQGDACVSEGSAAIRLDAPQAINNNQMAIEVRGAPPTALDYTVTGAFNSATTAAGNIRINFDNTAANPPCSGSASVTWQAAKTGNAPPVAAAGPDQSVKTGAVVMLDGGASSDPDGDLLSYHWTIVSQPDGGVATLDNPGAAKPTFTADRGGVYQIELMVSDGVVDSVADSVTITATTGNAPPVANAVADAQNVKTGAVVTLDGGASSDPDGDPLVYQWSLVAKPQDSGAVLSDATAVKPTFIVDVSGDYTAELVVRDAFVASAPAQVTVRAVAPEENSPPTANAGPDQNVKTGAVVTLDGGASSDPDQNPLSYAWRFVSIPSGSAATLADANTAKANFTADQDGDYVVALVVNDGTVDSAQDTVTVTAARGNSAPVAQATASQTAVTTGAVVTLDGGGSSDADNDPLTYQWTLNPPAGSAAALSDPSAQQPAFTVDIAGDYVAKLVVSDGQATSAESTVTITATAPLPPDYNGNWSGAGATNEIRAISFIVVNNAVTSVTVDYSVLGQQGDCAGRAIAPAEVKAAPIDPPKAIANAAFEVTIRAPQAQPPNPPLPDLVMQAAFSSSSAATGTVRISLNDARCKVDKTVNWQAAKQ